MRLPFPRALGWIAITSVIAAACGSSPETASSTSSSGSGGSGGSTALTIELPQAIDGALWANPFTYASVPLHVRTTGNPASVKVSLGSTSVMAQPAATAGEWIADLPIQDLPDGITKLTAEADAEGATPATISADLGIGQLAVQLTDYSKVGMARSPFVHRVNGAMWLTWIDRSETSAKLWLSRIDGAGRFAGDKVMLAASPAAEILYAFTAFGKSSVGILYKEPGVPYKTFFKTADMTGKELTAPVALDPSGSNGTFGGEIVHDEKTQSYIAVWRVTDGMGGSDVRWARFDEATAKMTGPVVVAKSGAGDANDPVGGFDPFSFEKVRVTGDLSVVSYVRYHWSEPLLQAIPRSEIAVVKNDGTLVSSTILGDPNSFTFHRESRIYTVADQLVSIHSKTDLLDPSDQPPMGFYASLLDAEGAITPKGNKGTQMFAPIDDRDEPFLIAHPDTFGVLAWLDHRAYTEDPDHGRINLYVSKVGSDLKTAGDPTVFEHVWFTAGLSDLNGVTAGTNIPLFWIDFRHSVGTDFRPEVYFETVWY
ncbi:MAG: hypothetical protein QM820_49125 [Minicystis sp.]